jgi:hypothetical protein
MTFSKQAIATIPTVARLRSMTVDAPASSAPRSLPVMRMEGTLYPGDRAHSIILADWMGELEGLFGYGNAELNMLQHTEWKGQQRTLFAVTVYPQGRPPEAVHGR